MLHSTLVRKLKKAGFEIKEEELKNKFIQYSSISADKKHVLEWLGGERNGKLDAICVKFRGINDHTDLMTDYFPGTYMETAKMAVEWMLKAW